MPSIDLAELSAKLFRILLPLKSEERARVIQAALILCGQDATATVISPVVAQSGSGSPAAPQSATDAATFVSQKAPANKGEALAVAARFRELSLKQDVHKKADLKKVFKDARRNFDDGNFNRDIDNARRGGGFFTLGTGRDSHTLSYYGQQFVDALPNRELALKLKRPTSGKRAKAAKKRKTK
jgi:hypothetical protein